jgi:uncharacterized protein
MNSRLLDVSLLDVGDGVQVEVCELRGAADGPTVALLGGVHGDELEGVLTVRSVLRLLSGTGLPAGRIRAVAVSNPPAHAAESRTSPLDDGNLARSFPGSPQGTITERIAAALASEVILGADLLIDLHSAGANYAMPFFAGYCDPSGAPYAMSFAAPLVWEHHGVNPGRSLAVAASQGTPAIYVEGSGGAALVRSEVDGYRGGVLRVLHSLGLVPTAPVAPAPRWVIRGGDGDVDSSVAAEVSGWCVTAVAAGDVVRAGDPIADVVGLDGAVLQAVTAPHDGIVMMLRRRAVVGPGTGIVMLGPVPEELT